MMYERIIKTVEPKSDVIRRGDHPVVVETEKYGQATLQDCDAGFREYPRVGYEIAFDEANGLAFVRDPSITDREDPTDVGRPYKF